MPAPTSVEVALYGPPKPSATDHISKLKTAAAMYVTRRATPKISAKAINVSAIATRAANKCGLCDIAWIQKLNQPCNQAGCPSAAAFIWSRKPDLNADCHLKAALMPQISPKIIRKHATC